MVHAGAAKGRLPATWRPASMARAFMADYTGKDISMEYDD
jgi:hypothetical protein